MDSMRPEDVLSAWRQRGFEGGIWVDPPGQVWEGYVHDTDELFQVIEGDVELELHGEKLRPVPGEEILIRARVVHSVRNLGSTTSRWLYAYAR
jgi:quercetin dioxygenase-like cupin family protein